MNIKYPHAIKVHYLTIAGKYITPNATQGRSESVTTGTLTASTASDPILTPNHRELALNFTVQSGSPSADIYLDVLDPVEPQNKNVVSSDNIPVASINLNPTHISGAPTTLRVVISNGVATAWLDSAATTLGNLSVPMRWQVRFGLGTASQLSVIATFEARE